MQPKLLQFQFQDDETGVLSPLEEAWSHMDKSWQFKVEKCTQDMDRGPLLIPIQNSYNNLC